METNEVIKSKRNIDFDILKAVAILLIVMSHLVAQDLPFLVSDYYFIYLQGYSHIPMFFLISGYLAHKGIKFGGADFIKKRAIRLLLPYISWSLVAIGARELYITVFDNFSLKQLVYDIYYTFIFAKSMWFFIALFITVLFVKMIVSIGGNEKNKWLLLFSSIVLIVIPVDVKIFGCDMIQILAIIFVLGYLLDGKWDKLQGIIRSSMWLKMLAILLLFTSPWYCKLTYTANIVLPIHRLMVAFTEILCLFFIIAIILPLIKKNKYVTNMFSTFGVYSLEIYCIHMFFVEYVMITTPDIVLNSIQIVSVIYYMVYTIAIMAIVVLIFKYALNRIGIYNLLMRGIQNRKDK